MNEDKQAICDKLCEALRLTRAGRDIRKIEYSEYAEVVYVWFGGPDTVGGMRCNVEGDSGAAIIADIVRKVLDNG